MGRPRRNNKGSAKQNGINLRQFKKELKLIPNDIKREMRFLDLLFAERNFVRTQAEREVLKDFIDSTKEMVEFHQDRLERYQMCYNQLKATKGFDLALLFLSELVALQGDSTQADKAACPVEDESLRTGTDG